MISITSLKDSLIHFFHEHNWEYHQFDEHLFYRDCKSQDGTMFYRILFSIGRNRDYLVIYMSSPLLIPRAHHTSVMEYICRVNFLLPLGHFEFNIDQSSVRYRLTLKIEEYSLSLQVLSSMVFTGGTLFLKYFPGLLEIIGFNKKPTDVLPEKGAEELSFHL